MCPYHINLRRSAIGLIFLLTFLVPFLLLLVRILTDGRKELSEDVVKNRVRSSDRFATETRRS